MEEPAGLDDSEDGTLEHPRGHPLPPPRRESYHLKLNNEYEFYICFVLNLSILLNINLIVF